MHLFLIKANKKNNIIKHFYLTVILYSINILSLPVLRPDFRLKLLNQEQFFLTYLHDRWVLHDLVDIVQ